MAVDLEKILQKHQILLPDGIYPTLGIERFAPRVQMIVDHTEFPSSTREDTLDAIALIAFSKNLYNLQRRVYAKWPRGRLANLIKLREQSEKKALAILDHLYNNHGKEAAQEIERVLFLGFHKDGQKVVHDSTRALPDNLQRIAMREPPIIFKRQPKLTPAEKKRRQRAKKLAQTRKAHPWYDANHCHCVSCGKVFAQSGGKTALGGFKVVYRCPDCIRSGNFAHSDEKYCFGCGHLFKRQEGQTIKSWNATGYCSSCKNKL